MKTGPLCPVNAPDLDTATWTVRHLFTSRGYRLLKLKHVATEAQPRPFDRVAIEVPGATACFIFAVSYRAA